MSAFRHPPVRPNDSIVVELALGRPTELPDPELIPGRHIVAEPGSDRKVGLIVDALVVDGWVMGYIVCQPELTSRLGNAGLLGKAFVR